MATKVNKLEIMEATVDVLCKYAAGIDKPDAKLLSSCFMDDAILDLSKFSTIGVDYPPFTGRKTIIDVCIKSVGEALDTSHTLSNFRVTPSESADEATFTCYAEAQHFKKGQGFTAGKKDNICVKSTYEGAVVREEDRWKIKHMEVQPIWIIGDVSVLKG